MALLRSPCELESLFWETFQEEVESISDTDLDLIPSARMAGLFYRYGFVFDIKGEVQSVRVDQVDGSLAYLHAFCTYAERSPISWATKASWSDIMSRFSKLPDFQE